MLKSKVIDDYGIETIREAALTISEVCQEQHSYYTVNPCESCPFLKYEADYCGFHRVEPKDYVFSSDPCTFRIFK